MENAFKLNGENPYKNANILMKLFFTWMVKVFYKGYRKGLEMKDMYEIRQSDESSLLADKLSKSWDEEVERAKANQRKPSLLRAALSTFLLRYIFTGVILFTTVVGIKSCQPLVLSHLMCLFTTKGKGDSSELYVTGVVLVVIVAVGVFIHHHLNFAHSIIGMRLRIGLSALIYRKMLRLNRKMLGQNDVGQIINLLTNDVNRFDPALLNLHYLWVAPIHLLVLIYFLWESVGVASLAGVLASVLITAFPITLGKKTLEFHQTVAEKTDYRINVMNEIVSCMQLIKMYAWEKPYEAMVKVARLDEVKSIRAANCLRGLLLTPKVFLERLMLFVTVITYALTNNEITAEKIYTLTLFFSLMHVSLAVFLPHALQSGAEALVSMKRIHQFLLLEENQTGDVEKLANGRVAMERVNASWVKGVETLKNINLEIPAGSLCAIIGQVGSGKSTLLHLLLGELQAKTGTIKAGGEISYASQEPWLFNGTVRNNILFGLEYDERRYGEVVHVCALEQDFKQFPEGDQSVVGERGMTLSGGQRARLNLARAIYREADIYIMDDPLSAVDARVSKHLFEKCILNYLRSKTRILVTHQLQFLKKADLIVVLNHGAIQGEGTYEELSESNLDFIQALASGYESNRNEHDENFKCTGTSGFNGPEEANKNPEEIVKVDKSPLKKYVSSSGNACMLVLLLLMFAFNQITLRAVDIWVKIWTELEEGKRTTNVSRYARSTSDYEEGEFLDTYGSIYVYIGLVVLLIILTVIRSLLFYCAASTASKNLHAKMFSAILQAPMRFFDSNPSGRVLNRFCKDMGAIDEMLPRALSDAVEISCAMIGIVIVISIFNYYIIIVILGLVLLVLALVNCYTVTAKAIKHVEGVSKSPVFSHVNSTANGISTIRASRAERNLTSQFDELQDVHTSVWFLNIASTEGFGLWLDILCVVLLVFIVFSFITLRQSDVVSGANMGLVITQALLITGTLQYGMRQIAETINQFASVERVVQYTTLEKEGDYDTPEEKKPPKGWPDQGKVSFDSVCLSYTPTDPPVLKDLSFSIETREKIGIVGRTGAGKSSIISALFRLIPFKGCITIDNIDTKTIGLHDLRKHISIIPQKPVLFSATMRYNLDPFDVYEDRDLWEALEQVELKDAIPSLDSQVDEGGSNFSAGQRQLICLARAIVRNNKILVLDEATSSVDQKTDCLIQRTIRRKFKDCTVLTIAHRLNTVMDSDKVLVMDKGKMVEFGHPQALLENPDGYFAKLVAETGPKTVEKGEKSSK